MRNSRPPRIPASQITPESVWQSRRSWLKGAGAGLLSWGGAGLLGSGSLISPAAHANQVQGRLAGTPNPAYQIPGAPTAEKDVIGYNNFYEFGTGKSDPADHAARMRTRPWTLTIEGEVEKPRTFDLDALMKLAPMEERVYRLRCVEAWSMVIPWEGYPLATLLRQVRPTSKAKFVQFETAVQPENMPGLRDRIIDWPYVEGLRMDEALHPLTLLVFGVYGKLLPNQNGAPLRVAIPWKYGFKSGKSIVRIRLLEHQPETSWARIAPHEYGFYANVSPKVPHPRWSQASERRIGDGFFAPRVPTLMFNGYADQVAGLYAGMDLRANY